MLADRLITYIAGPMSDISPYLQPKGFGYLQAHPTLSGDLANKVAHGYLGIRPDIKEIREEEVVFVDGSVAEADTIILATGYEYEIPFVQKGVLQVCGHFSIFFFNAWGLYQLSLLV